MDAQLYHFGQLECDSEDYLEGAEFEHMLGTAKWSPLVADIDPTNPGMEIISAPEGTGLDGGNWWHGAILIWSSNYESLQNITRRPGSTPGTYSSTRLDSQLGFAIVQDIDGDGLLELVRYVLLQEMSMLSILLLLHQDIMKVNCLDQSVLDLKLPTTVRTV